MGDCQVHGTAGPAWFLQGLRAGLCPIGTAHDSYLRVPRAASAELWLPQAGEEVNVTAVGAHWSRSGFWFDVSVSLSVCFR